MSKDIDRTPGLGLGATVAGARRHLVGQYSLVAVGVVVLGLMLLAAIRGGVNSLMAEILEDHVRLHITHPSRVAESPEELTEDLISLVRAYLK